MDAFEATKVVYGRIQALEPEHAAKIMGLLLGQAHGDKEMIRLAFGPESHLAALVAKVRADIALDSGASSSSSPFRSQKQQLQQSTTPVGRLLPSPNSWNPQNPFSRNAGSSCIVPDDGDDMAGYYDDDVPSPDGLSLFNDVGGGGAQSPLFFGEDYSPVWGARRCLSDAVVGSPDGGHGFKPCMYYARGFCKNGSGCRFIHSYGEEAKLEAAASAAVAAAAEQEHLLRSAAAAAAKSSPRSQLMANAYPFSPSSQKNINLLLQQQQQQNERIAATAAALLLATGTGDELKYMGRSPRMDRSDLAAALSNPGARQIYLTFPADSTFSEEDVSNYFSIYGPVQDVRIPYQQKRMFGFVTFVFPETVKLILAKGNPHFVCDARVLVKPYKEKGKVPEKFRSKPMFVDRGDFCSSPTGLLDSRDPFDLPQLGPRLLYGSSSCPEALMRKKFDEEELLQAIELQGRRFNGLQLLDLHSRASGRSHQLHRHAADGGSIAMANLTLDDDADATVAAAADTAAEPKQGNGAATNAMVNAGEMESGMEPAVAAPDAAEYDFQERGIMEHILPDSPFASPTKAAKIREGSSSSSFPASFEQTVHGSSSSSSSSDGSQLMPSNLLAPTSVDLSYASCFYQIPRFAPDQGAVGM